MTKLQTEKLFHNSNWTKSESLYGGKIMQADLRPSILTETPTRAKNTPLTQTKVNFFSLLKNCLNFLVASKVIILSSTKLLLKLTVNACSEVVEKKRRGGKIVKTISVRTMEAKFHSAQCIYSLFFLLKSSNERESCLISLFFPQVPNKP